MHLYEAVMKIMMITVHTMRGLCVEQIRRQTDKSQTDPLINLSLTIYHCTFSAFCSVTFDAICT